MNFLRHWSVINELLRYSTKTTVRRVRVVYINRLLQTTVSCNRPTVFDSASFAEWNGVFECKICYCYSKLWIFLYIRRIALEISHFRSLLFL